VAKIPTLKKLLREDYPADVSWLGKLLLALNGFIEATVVALNNNLTIGDNIAGKMAQVTVYKTQSVPVSFKWTYSLPPMALLIAAVRIKDGTSGQTIGQTLGIPEWYFDATNTSVVITKFPGLTLPDANNSYIFTLIALPGVIT
jgi:hypothetical protein